MWNKRLQSTAGRAHWKKFQVKPHDRVGKDVPLKYKHKAWIELSTKIINNEGWRTRIVEGNASDRSYRTFNQYACA